MFITLDMETRLVKHSWTLIVAAGFTYIAKQLETDENFPTLGDITGQIKLLPETPEYPERLARQIIHALPDGVVQRSEFLSVVDMVSQIFPVLDEYRAERA